MWKRCQREYFFHYCASIGGHEAASASSVQFFLHALRNRIPLESYCRRLLFDALRAEFFAATEDSLPVSPLSARLLARFESEFRLMLDGAPSGDHKLPMLIELTRPGAVPAKLAAAVKLRLAGLCAGAETSPLPELRRVPAEQRRRIAFPQEVAVGELRAHFTPLALWSEAGTLVVVEPAPAPDEEEPVMLLHRLFALNTMGHAPEKVRSRFFDAGKGSCHDGKEDFSVTSALRSIRADLAPMVEKLHSDRAEDFPRAPRECCGECRFAPFCRR